jgi:ribosome-associated translation inhibitor RaiA
MKIDIRSSNVPLSAALRDHTAHRIRLALRSMASRIDRVVVRLVDVNGPKGGPDKVCRMDVRLLPAGRLFVEATEADAYVAVIQAARRLDESASRRLGRRARPPVTRRPNSRHLRSVALTTGSTTEGS